MPRAAAAFCVAQPNLGVFVGWVCCVCVSAACSGSPEIVDRLGDLPEEEQVRIDEYTSRQMQLGYQIASTASQDDALLLCYEMCNRSAESCILSNKVCDAAAARPGNGPLGARCDVTRERCRVHRTKVPRQCPCDFSASAAANRR
ncbi:MAG: hypothetical protein FJ100_01405 [Deltaproteobacteria bacterium]|nr:hypothetical protein [Deltaproteobacteria bacterium]